MGRMLVVLGFAAIACGLIVYSKYSNNSQQNGSPGRYTARGNNFEAWKSIDNGKFVKHDEMLKIVCKISCPDSSFLNTLLPDDKVVDLFITYRFSQISNESGMSPTEAFGKILQAEYNIDVASEISSRTSLKDFLVMLNDLYERNVKK